MLDHVPLPLMMGCCCAYPTLWLGGPENNQILMGSSDLKGVQWPMTKYPLSTNAEKKAKKLSFKKKIMI
jgi:hypothetical protein